MLVPSAYMQSMSAFVAQNIGAQKLDRDVIAASADYLKAYGIDCMLTAFLF